MKATLLRDPYCEFHGDETIAMAEAKTDEHHIVVVAMGDAATELTSYGTIHGEIEIESGTPSDDWKDLVYQSVRAYRWDWNLTPECNILFAKSIKALQVQAA